MYTDAITELYIYQKDYRKDYQKEEGKKQWQKNRYRQI